MPGLVQAVIYDSSSLTLTGISTSLTYTDAGNTGRGTTYLLGRRAYIVYTGGEGCNAVTPVPLGQDTECTGATQPPDSVDPPLPPIWPYPTGNIYQREYWSMNLKMIRGDTFKFQFKVVQDGAAVNLTGAELRMTAKYDLFNADGSALFTRDNLGVGGITVTDAPNGTATVTVIPSNTSGLEAHRYDLSYDIQLKTSGGEIYTVLYGTLTVYPDATVTT